MDESLVVGGCLVAAIVLAGVVTVLTESLAVLGITPVGVAIYLAIGIGVPQYVLSRESGSALRLGLAVLAAVGGAISIVAGVATVGLNAEWGTGLITILFLVVVGNVVGAWIREFRAGYRSAE